ncbi:MAG: phospholipase D-like domain-containing protein [Sorangiineae bacterium]|nr:phospholipase D-like domain-containing protein [Sorangiineae bacterium]
MARMPWHEALALFLLGLEYGLKLIAIGTVPEGRRPSSSHAWLLLILLVPLVGFPLYYLIGSPYVRGRRRVIQDTVNQVIAAHTAGFPVVPPGAEPSPALETVLTMNHRLTGLPCVAGDHLGLYDDATAFFREIAEAVERAERYVHVEFYIVAWDATTAPVFQALARARARGVTVRLLLDHLGSRRYPGWRELGSRLTAIGIDWHLMMPLLPLRGQWRRPDLRNHRKLVVIDGELGFMGSHNLIDPAYGSDVNQRTGRRWRDLSVKLGGAVVGQLQAVFATDWLAETGEALEVSLPSAEEMVNVRVGACVNAMQVVPSGPAYPTEPNRNLCVQLMHQATRRLTITSPYFVPDESVLTALVGAAYRGVRVELFVSERSDQFIVGHAQRSYYTALLQAGVHIYLYPAPAVLHAKYFTVDDSAGVIGSSNLDYRSFALDYELTLLAFDGDLVASLQANDVAYRAASRLLTLEEWARHPWTSRYLDNVCRLASALM